MRRGLSRRSGSMLFYAIAVLFDAGGDLRSVRDNAARVAPTCHAWDVCRLLQAGSVEWATSEIQSRDAAKAP